MDGRRATCIERYAAPFHPSRKPKAPVLRKQNTGHGQALSTVLGCCARWALREHGNSGQAGGSLGRPRSRLHESTPRLDKGERWLGRRRSGWLAPARMPDYMGGTSYIHVEVIGIRISSGEEHPLVFPGQHVIRNARPAGMRQHMRTCDPIMPLLACVRCRAMCRTCQPMSHMDAVGMSRHVAPHVRDVPRCAQGGLTGTR